MNKRSSSYKAGVIAGKKITLPKLPEKKVLILPPGSQAFQDFLSKHGDLFNLTELERFAELPSGTLRHIRTGSRVASLSLYEKLQKKLLPKFCELCFVLQNYSGQMIQREVTF